MPRRSFLVATSASHSQLDICVETCPKNNSGSNRFSYPAASAILLVLRVPCCILAGGGGGSKCPLICPVCGQQSTELYARRSACAETSNRTFQVPQEGLRAKVSSQLICFSWRVFTFSNVNSIKTSENGRGDLIWNLMDCLQLFSL